MARKTDANTQETLDISFIRRQLNIAHVGDDNALAAFSQGREIFDVDAHCRKLDAFVARNKLEAEIWSENLLPCGNPDLGNRPVYFDRARWRKRKSAEKASRPYRDSSELRQDHAPHGNWAAHRQR